MRRNLYILVCFCLVQSGLAQFRNTNRDYHPKWYPDGESLIFYSYRPNTPGLFKINVKTGKEIQVSDKLGSHPNVSPDGKWIVYCFRDSKGISKLNILDANTGELQRVIDHQNDELSAFHPSWTPDGKILFNIEKRGLSTLMQVNIDGTGLKTLVEGMIASTPKSYDSGRKMVFGARNGHDTYALYTANIDGSNISLLTDHESHYGSPDIYRDGSKMVYEKRVDGKSQIFTTNLKTGAIKQLTFEKVDSFFPRWSPDGKTIAYASEKYGFAEIVLISADGSKPKNLTANSIDHTNPEYLDDKSFVYSSKVNGFAQLFYSDNGRKKALTGKGYHVEYSAIDRKNKRVYFISNHEGKGQIYATSLRGKRTEQITSDGIDKANLAISPDGRFIAFEANGEGNTDIHLLNISSGKIEAVLASEKNEGNPMFHPQGGKLIYNSDADGNYNLFEYSIASGQSKRITEGSKHKVFAHYAPDGQRIVYSTIGGQFWDLEIMDLSTGQTESLTSLPNYEQFPRWSVNGDKVIFQSSSDGSLDIYEVNINDKKITQLTQ